MGLYKHILVVDDDKWVLFILGEALTRLGSQYKITTASSGREALQRARERSYDLVFTDLRMADVDGVSLTEEIRALHPDALVIWMTAYDSHAVRKDASRLAVYSCLDKPMAISDIRQVVREALRSRENRALAGSKDALHSVPSHTVALPKDQRKLN